MTPPREFFKNGFLHFFGTLAIEAKKNAEELKEKQIIRHLISQYIDGDETARLLLNRFLEPVNKIHSVGFLYDDKLTPIYVVKYHDKIVRLKLEKVPFDIREQAKEQLEYFYCTLIFYFCQVLYEEVYFNEKGHKELVDFFALKSSCLVCELLDSDLFGFDIRKAEE